MMRRYYPDYARLVKRSALMYVALMLVLIVVVAGGSSLGAPGWLLGSAALLLVLAFFVWLWSFEASWRREERRRRADATETQALARERPRVTSRSVVRAVGLPALVFSCAAMLGLPLTLLGAVLHIHWLLVVGLVLLVAEVVDQAIIWPARRAHRGASK